MVKKSFDRVMLSAYRMGMNKKQKAQPLSELMYDALVTHFKASRAIVSPECLKHSILKGQIVRHFMKLVAEQTWREKEEDAREICEYFFDIAVDKYFFKTKVDIFITNKEVA